jgi:hypothetical protein
MRMTILERLTTAVAVAMGDDFYHADHRTIVRAVLTELREGLDADLLRDAGFAIHATRQAQNFRAVFDHILAEPTGEE